MVAPNGAKLTQEDHPALPVSIEATIATAVACREAGAQALHAHVRDTAGQHCLDANLYQELMRQADAQLGKHFPLQVTTEAVGRYSAAEQMHMVQQLVPNYISAALRELVPDGNAIDSAATFYRWCVQSGVAVQHILYDDADLNQFIALKERGVIPLEHESILIVLGRYVKDQLSDPSLVQSFADKIAGHNFKWMICAFGHTETECLTHAAKLGAGCRVGFENNRMNSDGSIARDNTQRVQLLCEALASDGATPCTDEDVHRWLGGL